MKSQHYLFATFGVLVCLLSTMSIASSNGNRFDDLVRECVDHARGHVSSDRLRACQAVARSEVLRELQSQRRAVCIGGSGAAEESCLREASAY